MIEGSNLKSILHGYPLSPEQGVRIDRVTVSNLIVLQCSDDAGLFLADDPWSNLNPERHYLFVLFLYSYLPLMIFFARD